MLQLNDLRIGNWLEHKFLNKQFQVEGLGNDLIYNKEACPVGIHMSGYSPIILTNEVLNKCGLKDAPTHTAFQVKSMNFDIKDNHVIAAFEDNEFGHEKEDEIIVYHLHQMQNLYFALTGTELTYTP